MLEPVSLDQLRVIIAIAETGSFSAAARRLGRAQSAISHAVASLESGLGLTLFDRSGRMPRFTDAGGTILADARGVVARADELRARAESMAEDVEPEFSLAVDVMFPRPVLIESLRALARAFPLLPIAVHTEALGAVEQRVRDGSCRLGISPSWPGASSDRIERRFLTSITLVSVVAEGHPLAAYPGPIPRREFERHVQLVLTDRGAETTSPMRGVISPRVWRFADLATRHDFLLAGMGFCNMPMHSVQEDLEAGRLVRIVVEGWGEPNYMVPLFLAYPRGRAPGRAACWLINHMEATFGREPAGAGARPPAP